MEVFSDFNVLIIVVLSVTDETLTAVVLITCMLLSVAPRWFFS